MSEVLENTTTGTESRNMLSRILTDYRNRFGRFWRVMLPLIALSFVLSSGFFFAFKLFAPEARWRFSTSGGLSARVHNVFDPETGTMRPSEERMGARSVFGVEGAAFDIGLLWLAICPIAFLIIQASQGREVTLQEAWRRTFRKLRSIIAACLFFWLFPAVGMVFMFSVIMVAGWEATVFLNLPFLILFFPVVGLIFTYFFVKWSLCHQCIIGEELTVGAAFRRSSELVRGRWWKCFGCYLLLAVVTELFTNLVFGLVMLLLARFTPEFAPLYDMLFSGQFFTLFFGGQFQLTVPYAPLWSIAVMVGLATLLHAFFAPLWALLTTHLYLERSGAGLTETAAPENVPLPASS